MTIKRKEILLKESKQYFLDNVNLELPKGFMKFYDTSNGGELSNSNDYIILWSLTDMIKLNYDYKFSEYAPDYFAFGTDGGDTALSIQKQTGYIYEIPFVGMANSEASFRCKTFSELLKDF